MFIEKNFETIIKVWIIICVGARIFFKDIYVLYMHIIGILFYILYCYKKNRKIKVTVSLGTDKEMLEVPDVVNLKQEEAEKRLREKGFKYTIEEEFSETIEIGYVIRQTPEAKSKEEKGTEVTIL